ncbi:MAG: chemotaxis protein CheA [Myxococcales bacterium]|nr:chemotaxis protein CheA [Myxococcales bacterium]
MAETVDGAGDKVLSEFLSEAQEIVENLNRDVLQLDDQRKRKRRDPDLLNRIFRAAHSLKGLSGMFGVRRMSDMAHDLENLLDSLRMGRVEVSETIIDVLFESVEVFNRLIAEAGGGAKVPKKDLSALLKAIEQAQKSGQREAAPNPLQDVDIAPSVLAVLTEYEEYRLIDNLRQGLLLYRVQASFDLVNFDEGLSRLTAELKSLGEVITTLPSSEPSAGQRIDFELIVGTDVSLDTLRERVEGPGIRVLPIVRKGGAAPPRPQPPTPPAAPAPDAPPAPARPAPSQGQDGASAGRADEPPPSGEGDTSLRSVSQTVRVDIRKLDNLMNIVGELVLVRTAIQAISDQLKAERGFTGLAVDLFKEARAFERKLDELQNGIMEVRMVPLGQNFDKLARMVRKLSRAAGKEVDLSIRGADTELDKLIVEDLADPLMHILRNSIDHGIEEPAERAAAGKPSTGTIRINAYQKGNHVVIEIADDGRGLDLDRICQVAMEKGLVEPERLADLTPRDRMNLIFLPGLSTSRQVTELSGRGVGLDVVKTNIANLSGMIDLDFTPGQGTRFTITLPITLAIIRALIVRVSQSVYAIPLNAVLEILSVPASRVRTIERRQVIELRGATLPLIRLADLFQLAGEAAGDNLFVVVVGLAQNRMGLVVDSVQGQQDIVIKSLGRFMSHVPGIAGATHLANQQTVLVLDVGELIEEALARE